ncbi:MULTISPECIES: class 1 fructose-bisphosphatase [Pseudoalteromonas]|uniref:Fructose-1,6-bisphosphatase class 1 2 n=1 Tax=Pseudoalteromonas translucida (strain TAC 125) TaxID=326442 RepID=F16A2_PSET1|nr:MULTISPECIES: class 1 fructose-bisphosphatase [Pseudoalteromonas]Q3IH61.1 RecName: Full=Fructose-1,6-bisphosphatase class 1 2; Short=FBPase class 1 2; AltName: Full=D-fructose-1,6-bisphosphate 1-phosphohydrolase class 1 2 [Pseudoalteromonas translucida TAC125]MBB1404626.1 class 1 fructose-bisphosphatase [Pseudoalteromonas sp. SG44-5]MBE0420448.1 class 1 fructose-bisphosphatase [Pseudoalteromonas nigrifaciens]CAI86814.1 Fructose-1,6-bisphosphatase [Pseudoalteromonas translucida]
MKRLNTVLKEDGVQTDLILLIRTILATSKEIAFRVSQGELAGVLGSTLNENIQGEVQKKLDVIANQLLKDILLDDNSVRTVASEEEDHAVGANPEGKFIVAFDPLDGSSNIDVNGQIGTIFTIYLARDDVPYDSDEQFNQLGANQVCAGYVLYGPSSLLVMSTGGPTRCYTLDSTHGGYLLTNNQLSVPEQSSEFAVNMANYRYWDEPTQVYFDKLLYTCKSFDKSSVRWNAAMVGDVHRILCRGGLFLYPQDNRAGNENGKIRLLYEANPLALLVENAGGKATSKGARILDIAPTNLHQRVPVVLGSIAPAEYFNSTVYNSNAKY